MRFPHKLWKTCELYLYKSIIVYIFITFSGAFLLMQITDRANSLLHKDLRVLFIGIINIIS